MVDYAQVVLNGFANGIGTIAALKIWQRLEKTGVHKGLSGLFDMFIPSHKKK